MDRRQFIAGFGTLVASVLAPARASAAGSAKILIVGGSAMRGAVGSTFEEQLKAAGYSVTRRTRGSSGLARPDFFDWQKEVRRLREAIKPHGTICMFGGNDGQGLFMGKKRAWIRWHEEGWVAEYGRRVRAFAEGAAPAGEHLFWIGMPPMRSPKLNGRMNRMNQIFRTAMSSHTNGHFFDTAPVLGTGNGAYADSIVVNGKRARVREPDGVHINRRGAKVLVNHVVPEIRRLIAVS